MASPFPASPPAVSPTVESSPTTLVRVCPNASLQTLSCFLFIYLLFFNLKEML